MSDRQINASAALSEFVDYYNLSNDFGETRFNATIKYEYDGEKINYLDADIQIKRDGHEYTITVLSDVPLLFPARFSDKFDAFYFEAGGALKITGDYAHSGLGEYTAYVIAN